MHLLHAVLEMHENTGLRLVLPEALVRLRQVTQRLDPLVNAAAFGICIDIGNCDKKDRVKDSMFPTN